MQQINTMLQIEGKGGKPKESGLSLSAIKKKAPGLNNMMSKTIPRNESEQSDQSIPRNN